MKALGTNDQLDVALKNEMDLAGRVLRVDPTSPAGRVIGA